MRNDRKRWRTIVDFQVASGVLIEDAIRHADNVIDKSNKIDEAENERFGFGSGKKPETKKSFSPLRSIYGWKEVEA